MWRKASNRHPRVVDLYSRHYSSARVRARKGIEQATVDWLRYGIAPNGRDITMLSEDNGAVFGWLAQNKRDDGQDGVQCYVFRNEGSELSSKLIQEACSIAWTQWPGARLWTYVDPGQVASGNPGYCFKAAGWVHRGESKRGLHILEILPKENIVTPDTQNTDLVSMTRERLGEIIEYVKDTQQRTLRAGEMLLEVRDTHGYRLLGYRSFTEFIHGEFTFGYERARQLIQTIEIQGNLKPVTGEVDIKHAHILAPLTPEQQREVAQEIDLTTATRKQVEAAVKAKQAKAPRFTVPENVIGVDDDGMPVAVEGEVREGRGRIVSKHRASDLVLPDDSGFQEEVRRGLEDAAAGKWVYDNEPPIIDVEAQVESVPCPHCGGSGRVPVNQSIPPWLALLQREIPRTHKVAWQPAWEALIRHQLEDIDGEKAMRVAGGLVAYRTPYKHYGQAFVNWYKNDRTNGGNGNARQPASEDEYREASKRDI